MSGMPAGLNFNPPSNLFPGGGAPSQPGMGSYTSPLSQAAGGYTPKIWTADNLPAFSQPAPTPYTPPPAPPPAAAGGYLNSWGVPGASGAAGVGFKPGINYSAMFGGRDPTQYENSQGLVLPFLGRSTQGSPTGIYSAVTPGQTAVANAMTGMGGSSSSGRGY